jgi:hypothetical protein
VITKVAGYSTRALLRLGLTPLDTRNIIRGWRVYAEGNDGLLTNVMIANAPQVIFSFIYFFYNSIFTIMVMSNEWDQLQVSRKGLRVSAIPENYQRSTYFLQLPYRFGVPILATSALIHWLISQSFFIVRLDSRDPDEYHPESRGPQTTCAYSPLAIILAMVSFGLMALYIIVMRFRRLSSVIPVVGSCSLAIAAACHPSPSQPKATVDPSAKLQWGVMGLSSENVGHCGFSDQEVTDPIIGHLYA